MRSCGECVCREVCKIYHGEMTRRDYWGKDFIKELANLKKELAAKCREYLKSY